MHFKYLRVFDNERPQGCIAFNINEKDRTVSYQVSVLNPNPPLDADGNPVRVPRTIEINGEKKEVYRKVGPDVFNRTFARSTAAERLETSPITVHLIEDEKLVGPWAWAAMAAICFDMKDRKEIPGRARRIARDWYNTYAKPDPDDMLPTDFDDDVGQHHCEHC